MRDKLKAAGRGILAAAVTIGVTWGLLLVLDANADASYTEWQDPCPAVGDVWNETTQQCEPMDTHLVIEAISALALIVAALGLAMLAWTWWKRRG